MTQDNADESASQELYSLMASTLALGITERYKVAAPQKAL